MSYKFEVDTIISKGNTAEIKNKKKETKKRVEYSIIIFIRI